ncbi:MAG TPA: ribonuclease HII [Kineosporiaceae bacterium]|nr:ribonuclease HII [Kineosporiaceae bacterium]
MTEQGRAAGTPRPRVRPRTAAPTLREERRLLRTGHTLLAGMDEVGRGALAGPVTVGVVVVDIDVRTAPAGVRDSKLLAPAARKALVPRLRRWARSWAVGHAEPDEIDTYGIMAALRLAGRRALAQLPEVPTCILLDGNHDWLTGRRRFEETGTLFPVDPVVPFRPPAPPVELPLEPTVHTMIKADLRCAAVAAASVLAKVERDGIMVERSGLFPGYGWEENKGYSAPEHGAAIRRLGPCMQHRQSWSLPLTGEAPDTVDPELAYLEEAELDGAGGEAVDLDEVEFDVELGVEELRVPSA